MNFNRGPNGANVNSFNQILNGNLANLGGGMFHLLKEDYVNNRCEGNIPNEIRNLIHQYDMDDIREGRRNWPFIMRNMFYANVDEKITIWDFNRGVTCMEIIRWKNRRYDMLYNIIAREEGLRRYEGTEIEFYVVSRKFFDRMMERKAFYYPKNRPGERLLNFFTGEMDTYAFSRGDLLPSSYPTNGGSYILDMMDFIMFFLTEMQVAVLDERQKHTLWLEYRRIKKVCAPVFRAGRIYLRNTEAFQLFLTLLGRFATGNGALAGFMEYFNFTECNSRIGEGDEERNINELDINEERELAIFPNLENEENEFSLFNPINFYQPNASEEKKFMDIFENKSFLGKKKK